MKRIVRLTEGDLIRLVKRVIRESTNPIDEIILECMKGIDPMATIGMLADYPTCLSVATEAAELINGGKVDFLKIGAIASKIPGCTQELIRASADPNVKKLIEGTLNCLQKKLRGF